MIVVTQSPTETFYEVLFLEACKINLGSIEQSVLNPPFSRGAINQYVLEKCSDPLKNSLNVISQILQRT